MNMAKVNAGLDFILFCRYRIFPLEILFLPGIFRSMNQILG